ncbi:alpha/beta hydrolase, partial [Streptomyces flavofungini]|uniref:alpha/beta hydrolase n=1 Tax=Streptomyces flavofungini TaxID=68200 RepID=UPI0034DFC083
LPARPQGPQPAHRRPTVLFLHGGGYTLCGLDSHDATARGLCARAGAVVVSVGYRLAPEHPFPAAVDDAYAALLWAADHSDGPLVTAGDSSGGGLAAAVAVLARDRRGPAVALHVLLYPLLDAAQDTASYRENASGYYLTAVHLRWFWRQYLGDGGDPGDPRASPLRTPDPRGLPAAYVVTAGCDPLRDEGVAYARRLGARAFRWSTGTIHGCSTGSSASPACFRRRTTP